MTTARRRGAIEVYIERITHNASGSMVDHYTHTEWDPLCDVVMRLPWKRLPAAILPIAVGADRDVLKNAEKPPVGDAFGDTKNFRAKFGSKTEREKGFETFPQTGKQQENSGNQNSVAENEPLFSSGVLTIGNSGAARRQLDPEEADFIAALAESNERAEVAELLATPLARDRSTSGRHR